MSISKLLICKIAFVLCMISLLSAPTDCLEVQPSPRLYIFGDSLFDAGNGLVYSPGSSTGKWPFGMSSPNKSTGRFSDGLLLPDYIALFANLSVMPPSEKKGANLDQGANFAYPGAGVLDRAGVPMNLDKQLARFMSLQDKLSKVIGTVETMAVMKRSLFLFSMGGGNYIGYKRQIPNPSKAQKTAYVNSVVEKLMKALHDIYLKGGRKFALQNVMPLGCRLESRVNDKKCEPQLMDMANLHNAALVKAIEKLQIKSPGFYYSIFDFYTTLGDRIDNPTKYGLKVGVLACCGRGARRATSCGTNPYELCKNPNEYVFWDGGHLTQNVNHQLAELFWSGGPNVTHPMNLQQLFQLSPTENSNFLRLAVE